MTLRVRLAPVGMVGADREQSGIFALGAAVCCKRRGLKACYLAQPGISSSAYDPAVSRPLICRSKWVYGVEFGPAQWDQLRSGVQFHGAAAEGRSSKVFRLRSLFRAI